MRKFLCVALACAMVLCAILLAAFRTTAYADDDVDLGRSGDNYYAETEMSVYRYSSYRVSIPYQLQEGAVGFINLNDIYLEAGYSMKMYITNLNENGMIPIYNTTARGDIVQSEMLIFFDNVQLTSSNPLMAVHTGAEFSDDGRSASHTIQYISLGLPEAGEFTGVISYRIEVSPEY